jgi:hypothetical protein
MAAVVHGCTVCSNPRHQEIDQALVGGTASGRAVARQFGISEASARRHRAHIPKHLAESAQAGSIADADSLVEKLKELLKMGELILGRAVTNGDYGAGVSALRELRSNYELIAKVTGELESGVTVNVLAVNAKDWPELQRVILGALQPHPEALRAVAGALDAHEAAHG